MESLITTLAVMAFTICSYGQSFRAVFFNPNVYRTKIDLPAIRLADKDLKRLYNDAYIIKVSNHGHLDYKIINEDDNGYVIIRILPKVRLLTEYSPDDGTRTINVVRQTTSKQLKNDTNNAYNYYFAIKKDAFKPLGKILLSNKIVATPLVHPIKLRPSKGREGWNLSGDFTLSYSFGIRLKLGDNPFGQNYLSLVPYGFGIGAAEYFKENNDGTLTEKTDAFSITYYQGGMLLTIQKINFGLFTGLDAMIDKQNDWFYQSRPWFSFGLGYKFKND